MHSHAIIIHISMLCQSRIHELFEFNHVDLTMYAIFSHTLLKIIKIKKPLKYNLNLHYFIHQTHYYQNH